MRSDGMGDERRGPFLIAMIGIGILVASDQLLKAVMHQWLGPQASLHRFDVWGRSVAFEYVENRGAAFGMFGHATQVLAILSVVVGCIGIGWLWRHASQEAFMSTVAVLIVAGAIGNAIDRITRGFVVDYMAIGQFWRFNLADACVSVGTALLIFVLAFPREDASEKEIS